MSVMNAAQQADGVFRRRATLAAMAALAVAGSMVLSAAATPARLLGVSSEGNTLLIQASEPVSYVVSRPDPMTVLVDLRNVTVAEAATNVPRKGMIAGVSLEQSESMDGSTLGRVRLNLVRAAEYHVRSSRNTIRVELWPAAAPQTKPVQPLYRPQIPPPPPMAAIEPVPSEPRTDAPAPATMIERVRSTREPLRTTITLTGNGRLAPASVTESLDQPRRVVLDFPNVTSRAPAQSNVDSALVSKIRIGVNSRAPLLTQVVVEIGAGVTYHVEQSAMNGNDLAIVFEPPQATGTILLAPGTESAPKIEREPDISIQDAIANAAGITPPEAMSALDTLTKPVETQQPPASAPRPAPKPATPRRAQPIATPKPAPPPPATATPQPAVTLPPPIQPPATPAPATQAPAAQPVGNADKKYTGTPIDMDFQGADLRSVLRVFADISGLNMIIDPDVQGTVDLVLTQVPWDQALDVILRGLQLDYTVDGTIVRIARIDTLKKEQESRQQLTKAAADAGTLEVRTYALSYARAVAAAPLIKRAALSNRGDVQVDERTNTLIITDLPARLQTAAQLLATLDRAEPQVEVEARIVQTTRDFARIIGVQWGLNGRMAPDIGNTTNLAFPNRGSIGGRTGTLQAPDDPRSAGATETTPTAVNLGAPGANSAIGVALGAVNGAFNLDIALSALERTGKGRVLSTPRLTTQNNIEAEVAQGVQIPVQTSANNTVTVSFKDAVLLLKVTPQITSANTVIMKITIENATPDFSREVGGIPPIDTQRALTQVQVDDGATTVIGGIFVSREQVSNNRTPVLHRLPLLGWLFRRDTQQDESRELLIFITPRILRG
ncbi:MAG: type IV pilus secretin PilQ [Acidobacteria bacterium]|nr:type IV pilus secretin PilQ [Acidobacteriota bacterium]MCA1651946.1 type IV pilus secretin PilQ [Acidobacteriota bacterium]